MNLTLFFVFLTFTSGLFLLLSGVMHLPTLRTSRVMMDTGRKEAVKDTGCIIFRRSSQTVTLYPDKCL